MITNMEVNIMTNVSSCKQTCKSRINEATKLLTSKGEEVRIQQKLLNDLRKQDLETRADHQRMLEEDQYIRGGNFNQTFSALSTEASYFQYVLDDLCRRIEIATVNYDRRLSEFTVLMKNLLSIIDECKKCTD